MPTTNQYGQPIGDPVPGWAPVAVRLPGRYGTLEHLDPGRALGTLSLMRHDGLNRVLEVGHVVLSGALQRTPVSTEAQLLLMRYVFDELGHRRYEGKCDSLNAPSHRAAERLGFSHEGTFRHAVVYKGRTPGAPFSAQPFQIGGEGLPSSGPHMPQGQMTALAGGQQRTESSPQ